VDRADAAGPDQMRDGSRVRRSRYGANILDAANESPGSVGEPTICCSSAGTASSYVDACRVEAARIPEQKRMIALRRPDKFPPRAGGAWQNLRDREYCS